MGRPTTTTSTCATSTRTASVQCSREKDSIRHRKMTVYGGFLGLLPIRKVMRISATVAEGASMWILARRVCVCVYEGFSC